MSRIATTKDLNASIIEKELWNRQQHILRLISYSQMYITYGDINQDLGSMYQGLQMLLDTITPDFEENKKKEGKNVVLKGMRTEKFEKYRKLLDNSNALSNQSKNPHFDVETRIMLRNSAYKKMQTLKYSLLQECERLGYNAKKTDTTETYREGNN